MTPRQAAKIIGCTPAHVRHLIREGKVKHKRRKLDPDDKGNPRYEYHITQNEVERIAKEKPTRGWPRGKKRV